MNGFIKRSVAVLCLGGVAIVGGCCTKEIKLCDCYDNCWLERYAFQARSSVKDALGAQVNNGHVLDQTVFTYHFVPGTDVLTAGGTEHLTYLARRRPQPDSRIYLQTAQDVLFDPAAPEKYTAARFELDSKRVAAIQHYLNAETAGRPVTFDVAIHDAPTPGLTPIPGKNVDGKALPNIVYYNNYTSIMPAGSSGSSALGGGSK